MKLHVVLGFLLAAGCSAPGSPGPEGPAGAKGDPGGAIPPGAVMAFAGPNAPEGWILCDGSEVSRTQYSALFAVIGISHGLGDGVNTFLLPDYRGRFLRGVNAGQTSFGDPDASTRVASGSDGTGVGDSVGSLQADALQAHKHSDSGHTHVDSGHTHTDSGHTHNSMHLGDFNSSVNGWVGSLGSYSGFTTGTGQANIQSASANIGSSSALLGDPVASTAGSVRTAAETRPANVYVNFIIKY